MTSINAYPQHRLAPVDLPVGCPGRTLPGAAPQDLKLQQGRSAKEVKEKFIEFVGQTFYGQMIKSMRTSVGKPAYFHGGRGEEVFQGQLDQQLAEYMTKASASDFAEPLFKRQFPQLASELSASDCHDLSQLSALSRR